MTPRISGIGFFLAAAVAASCGDARAPAEAEHDVEPICPAQGITLAAAAFAPPDRMMPGQQVQFENGARYLFVDGECKAFVASFTRYEGARRLELSVAEAEALSARVRFSEWDEWTGAWFPNLPIFDADIWAFSQNLEASVSATCEQGCAEGGEAPEVLVQAARELSAWIEEAWDDGEALQGDVRYLVVKTEAIQEGEWITYGGTWAWPVAGQEASQVAITRGEAAALPYGSGLLATGNDAEALRAIRDEYVASAYVTVYHIPYLVIRDASDALYQLWMRDSLPFEDEHGLVRPR